jgi:protein-disulfide isomerase
MPIARRQNHPTGRAGRGAALLLGLALLPTGLAAEPPPLTAAQTEAVQALIQTYFLDHPEALVEAMQRAQATMRSQAQAAARRMLGERREELVADAAAPVAGNPQGDVTLVEFFDYRCAYCKKVGPGVEALLAEDRGLRLVHKQLPVLGPDSVFAARAALAAQRQGRYLPLHAALMATTGPLTNEVVLATAERLGLDRARLVQDMATPEIEAALARNAALAKSLGINGTPSFVIGETLVPGAAEPAVLRQLVAAQRQGEAGAGATVAARQGQR